MSPLGVSASGLLWLGLLCSRAPGYFSAEPALSEASVESGGTAVGPQSSAGPVLVSLWSLMRRLHSVTPSPLSLPLSLPQVQSGPAPSAFGVGFHKCAQLKSSSDPPEISFLLLIHNMASAVSQVSVRDCISGIVPVRSEGREVERGFQSFTIDSLQAGAQVVLNYTAQIRSPAESSVLELPAFLTFSNASQNDVSMFGPITANFTLRFNATSRMSPSPPPPVLLFAGFAGGFLASFVLALLGFLGFVLRLSHKKRNRGGLGAELGDCDDADGVKEEAAFENKMVDVMILEEPQNVAQALDNLQMSSLVHSSQQLEAARLQIQKDLVVALLSGEGRILEVVQGQVMGAEGRLKEQLEGKMAAFAAQCNRESREAMEAELHRQREEQQRAERLCQGAEPQVVLNVRLLLEKLHKHRQSWLQRHLLVRHEEASARLQRESTEQRRGEHLQIFSEELEEATQLGEMDQRRADHLLHQYFNCQDLLEQVLDEVVAHQRFVLCERHSQRKLLMQNLEKLHSLISETFSSSSTALDDALCHIRRQGSVPSEQLQSLCEQAQQQGALLRQQLENRLTEQRRSLRAGVCRRRRDELSHLLRLHRQQQKSLSSSLSLSPSPLSLDEADLLLVIHSWRNLLSSQSSELSELLKRLDQEALDLLSQTTMRLLREADAALRDLHSSVCQSVPGLVSSGEHPLLSLDHTALSQDMDQALNTTTEQLQGALERELREQRDRRAQSRDFFRRLCSSQLSLSQSDLLQLKLQFHRCFSVMDQCLVLPPAELRAKLHCALEEWREEQEALILIAPQKAAVVKRKKSRSSRPGSELQEFQKLLLEKVALFETLKVQENVLKEKVLEQMQLDRNTSQFSQCCLLSSQLISGQLQKVHSRTRALQTWAALMSLQKVLIQEVTQRDKMADSLQAHSEGLSATEQQSHKDLSSLLDSSPQPQGSLCDTGLFQPQSDCRMELLLQGALHRREELLSALAHSLECSSSRAQVLEELKEELELRRLQQICQQECVFVSELLKLAAVPLLVLKEALRLLLPSLPEEELLTLTEKLNPRHSLAESSGSSPLKHTLVLKLREDVLREAGVNTAEQTERLNERRCGLLLKLLPSACAPESQQIQTEPRPDFGDPQPGPSAPRSPGPGPGPEPGLSPGPEPGLSPAPVEYMSVSPDVSLGCRGDRDVRVFVFREAQSPVLPAEGGERRRKRNFLNYLNFKKNSVQPTDLDLD